jgi:hypothetical protein
MMTADLYQAAKERFVKDPHKAFQRHIREAHGELTQRTQLPSLSGAVVERITNREAGSIIKRYEWLGTMGTGTRASYGLHLSSELLGVACFGVGGSHEARNICGWEHIEKAACLQRGACVPWAPKNAASFLIRSACRQAMKDHGWKIFFAYSDPDAGEIGTVYQAVGWHFLGAGLGRRHGACHIHWIAPDGTVMTSNSVHKARLTKRDMFASGYEPVAARPKGKYVWFEGSPRERQSLKKLCRYPFQPYPKRKANAILSAGLDPSSVHSQHALLSLPIRA